MFSSLVILSQIQLVFELQLLILEKRHWEYIDYMTYPERAFLRTWMRDS